MSRSSVADLTASQAFPIRGSLSIAPMVLDLLSSLFAGMSPRTKYSFSKPYIRRAKCTSLLAYALMAHTARFTAYCLRQYGRAAGFSLRSIRPLVLSAGLTFLLDLSTQNPYTILMMGCFRPRKRSYYAWKSPGDLQTPQMFGR